MGSQSIQLGYEIPEIQIRIGAEGGLVLRGNFDDLRCASCFKTLQTVFSFSTFRDESHLLLKMEKKDVSKLALHLQTSFSPQHAE